MDNPTRQKQTLSEKGVHVPVYPFEKKDQMNIELLQEKLRPTKQQFTRSIKGKTEDEDEDDESYRRNSFAPLSYDNLSSEQQSLRDTSHQSRFRRKLKNEFSKQIHQILDDLKQGKELSNDPYENSKMISQIKEIKRHEDNMNMMDDILDASELEETILKNKVGNRAFSSVTVYERNLKRQKESEKTQKLLDRIRTRNRSTDLLSGHVGDVKHRQDSPEKHSNQKNAWLNESKERARENILAFTNMERIQENSFQEQMRHQNEVDQLKHQILELTNEKDFHKKENTILNHKIESLNETIESLKHTREVLRQKIGKSNIREMESQQRLRLFEEYQPLFEDLRDHFKFDSPEEVINRMKMLEKKQTESYKQLMDSQQYSSDLERKIANLNREHELELRERLKDTKAKLDITSLERDNFQTAETSIRRELKDYREFKDKYLSLHSAVMDIWTTWLQDLEQIGTRQIMDLVEPDYSNAFQVLESIKNLVISFTPSKAGDVYIKFSRIANNYWKKYYSEYPNLKGKPQLIFTKIGETLDEKTKRINQLELEIEALKREKQEFMQERTKIRRENRALETELNLATGKRRYSQTPTSNSNILNNSLNTTMNTTQNITIRPQSASARLMGKHRKSATISTPLQPSKRPHSAITRKKPSSKSITRPSTAGAQRTTTSTFFVTQNSVDV